MPDFGSSGRAGGTAPQVLSVAVCRSPRRWAPERESMRLLAIVAVLLSSSRVAAASDVSLELSRLSESRVKYHDSSKIVDFPIPVISVRREGLSSGPAELNEIKEKILYPLIERSPQPVSAIILEWYGSLPDALGVSVVWSDGHTRESLIRRAPQGHYDEKAYEVFFAKPTP